MRRLILALAAASSLALTACGPTAAVIPGPAVIADRTKADEQAGITVTLAYTAAARAAALAITSGVVSDPAKVKRIGELDSRAYAAVQAVRQAYLTANAASYAEALANANAAIAAFTAATK